MKTKSLLFTAIATIAFIAVANTQNVNIPDANFKAALVNNASINTNGDAEIQTSEAAAFTGAINVSNSGITNFTGIGAFTALTSLECNWNFIASLNLTACTALTNLDCSYNQLTALNISSCTALTTLNCSGNQLTYLYVVACTGLTTLNCSYNQLISLDVSSNTALTTLDCSANQLTNLNVKNGNNMNMITFYALGNPNLSCIEVDRAAWSTSMWYSVIDATAYFSEDCGPLGITDNNESIALMFYPNPTTGALYLSEPANISLSDLSGKLLLEEKNTNQLDLSALPAGMYFLHFGENNLHTYKVIKE